MGWWTERTPQLGAENFINALAVFNNKLYGGTSSLAKLYRWNDVNAWTEVAPQLNPGAGAEDLIESLAVYNNRLFGGTGLWKAKLYEYFSAWAAVDMVGGLVFQGLPP